MLLVPWLDPPLTIVQYIMSFWFSGHNVFIQWGCADKGGLPSTAKWQHCDTAAEKKSAVFDCLVENG